MTKTEALQNLQERVFKANAYTQALSSMHWDITAGGHVSPESMEPRGAAMGFLMGEAEEFLSEPEVGECIDVLEAEKDSLNEVEGAFLRVIKKSYKKIRLVPREEREKYAELCVIAENTWEKAKNENDFSLMEPYYEQIFATNRKFAEYYGYGAHPYDALVDEFEEGATVADLDAFFDVIRESIPPIVKQVADYAAAHGQFRELKGDFGLDAQRELTGWLATFVGFDTDKGRIGEVEHPFCTTINRFDVRITTHYYEDLPLSSAYSVMHESGHAVYEQNMPAELIPYGLDDCASIAVHESQSRFYENIIGRDKNFTPQLFKKMKALFPKCMRGWNAKTFYHACNIARPSLIRTEADELTYPLHVLIRYELEKALIAGEIKVHDLPGLWADKYEQYLGIRPQNDKEGVLQDMHWSGGVVGYFPTYALGSAYSAQLLHAMKKTVDVDAVIASGDISPVTAWLKEHIHSKGALIPPKQLIEQATGEPFSVNYYINYLRDKYLGLYS